MSYCVHKVTPFKSTNGKMTTEKFLSFCDLAKRSRKYQGKKISFIIYIAMLYLKICNISLI